MLRRPRAQTTTPVQSPPEGAHFVPQPKVGASGSFVVCNLSQDEINLEPNEEISHLAMEPPPQPTQTPTDASAVFPTRARRPNRRVIDYQHLNTFGFQDREEKKRRKSHANQDS